MTATVIKIADHTNSLTDEGLMIVALYERWQELTELTGSMPRNDHKFWKGVDQLTPTEFGWILEWAMQSRYITTTERLWAHDRLQQQPFQLRNKQDRLKTSQTNRYLWKILLNAMEQIQRAL